MHITAEYGIAAHWDYKLQDPTAKQKNNESGSYSVLNDYKSNTQTNSDTNLIAKTSQSLFTAIDAETVSITKMNKTTASKLSQYNLKEAQNDLGPSEINLENLKPNLQESYSPGNLTISMSSAESTSSSNFSSYIEALSIARTDLVQKSIFLFVSPLSMDFDGKIIPACNCPL